MTQIIVTLEPTADSKFLRKMIENMKGVFKTTVKKSEKHKNEMSTDWLEQLHQLKKDIDPSVIDTTDERTNHIMSK